MPENTDPSVTSDLISLACKCKKILPSLGEICSQYARIWREGSTDEVCALFALFTVK